MATLAGDRDVAGPRSLEILEAADQHSGVRTVVLHLLPGALITTFYFGVAPVVRSLGFPSIMALFLAISFVLIPFQLGYLYYQARKNGVSLSHVVHYREPVPRGQFVVLVASLFGWSGFVYVLLYPPLDAFFLDTVFFWVPEWFNFAEDFSQYSIAVLLITWVFGLILNGFAGPIVEELYFRGYLLPRIARFGAWAPVLNTAFFSLYHFFTPWQNLARVMWVLPMVYATWWKRNIYVSMAVHILGNVAGMLLLLLVFLGPGSS